MYVYVANIAKMRLEVYLLYKRNATRMLKLQ